MATRTITHYITPEDSPLGGTSLEIIATIGKDLSSKKIPISLTICYQKDKPEIDEQGKVISKTQSSTLQYYHYSIPNKLRNRKNNEFVIGIPLLDTNNDWVRDISRKLADATAKKYEVPCYVSWSTTKPSDVTSISMDQMFVLRNCINFINTLYN
ncbi:similar to Saccharomyces cerevisiae YPL144W POC4 Component of a heterodimeric Poc4p-Irc25p chaperone involved in assembly of alpha subunits into the 20S proteasome [Maudiozyma saulgeensis]|uniref:Similar to Saccharomyces cerevisiae YPL144W POC4 Component of a heterodimeric Poc4p-Irc25p chaperone involved in assembly of alpha subunits into the 20S proteasome n=1 Tax=Maudiozyma saulgeensis TaxID=1789683 RepID=A0A1X7R3G6_9SACH|nr:similar to Saccharomyces cerevisiae YPL144W POC4 Component of a heterodimeric Poc4p-Irc25p chaperone involved in assembly of alpha subunits into the 20S proteasome [Kazachstania saulgeensis]